MTSFSPIPTRERCAAEDEAVQLFTQCGNCPHLSAQNIPFKREWLEQSKAAESIQVSAAAIVFRANGIQESQGIANWLKQLAHEIEGLVLQEQLQRTRALADEQSRQHTARRCQSRIEVDANIMAAIDALEGLIDGRGTKGVL
jgi:hypothetical protein